MWYLAYLSLYLTFFETVIPMFEDPHTLFEFLYFWVDLLLVFFCRFDFFSLGHFNGDFNTLSVCTKSILFV